MLVLLRWFEYCYDVVYVYIYVNCLVMMALKG